ncbi:MAG: hypothetical protein OEY52_15995 [Gammaproteobacteria bacterium]|nr:hypothetical protein [Gammaproteobacteria bacterium]
MLATHLDTELRYSKIRKEALNAASEILRNRNGTNIVLSEINSDALKASKEWQKSNTRIKNWDWVEGYSVFKFRYPKRFEMALWEARKLIGLSMGRPTYQGTALRLDVVEASPSDLGDRPSIFETVLLGYGIYARLINAKQIRIMHPVNEKVRTYYEKYSYKYVASGDYLFKEVL